MKEAEALNTKSFVFICPHTGELTKPRLFKFVTESSYPTDKAGRKIGRTRKKFVMRLGCSCCAKASVLELDRDMITVKEYQGGES